MRSRLPWGVFAIAITMLLGGVVLFIYLTEQDAATFTPHPLVVPGYGLVGALIASRTRNRIGVLLLAYSLMSAAIFLVFQIADLIELQGGSMPASLGALWPLSYAPFGLVLVLFPTGYPQNRFWSVVAWSTALAWGAHVTASMASSDVPLVLNLSAVGTLLVSTTAPVFRRLGASAELRKQLKWLAYALAVGASALLAGGLAGGVVPSLGELGAFVALLAATAGVPAAIGIAVTRHRLYDIDVVIKRTLIYSLASLVLAGTYVGGVLLIESALGPLSEGSDLAVAASTLVVAALFRPVVTRMRSAVDRRFYRERYDARRMLDAFAAKLRDEVDLANVADDVRGFVDRTVHPAHVTLWLVDRSHASALPPSS